MKIVESSSDEEEEEEMMKISSSGKQAKLSSQPDTGTAECIVEENKLYPNDDQNFVQFHFSIMLCSFFNKLSRIVPQRNFHYRQIFSEIMIS